MFDRTSDSHAKGERDRVFNSETRRALRRAARLVGVVAFGALTAAVVFSLAAATAIFSVSWQLHLAATVIVALALPIAVPYAMLRTYGLATRDVVYVAKQTYREAVAEIIALSGNSTVSAAFDEASAGTDEATDAASHSPVEDGSDDADPGFESGEFADESGISNETSQTEPTLTETES